MHARVLSVQALPKYMLSLTFVGGERRLYDMKPWIKKHPVFKALKLQKGLFDMVELDCGGYGISWNDRIDLDANELLDNGQKI